MTLVPALIALGATWLLIRWLLAHAAHLPLDRPNARSLHVDAIPRIGGLAVLTGWLAATIWLPGAKPWLAPLAVLVAVSVLDDRRSVHPALRLAAHFCAAAGWVWLAPPPLDALLAVLLIVWMINLYNFMDGSDGLAGAMAVIGFTAYAAAAWTAGGAAAGTLAALAASSAAFLIYNAPPARIFLGDAGSVPLGFLASAFGLLGWTRAWWPAWFPMLVFLPFIADATITLMLRLVRGERVWEAHRDHCYQHLVQLGWGHARTLALYAALMVACAASAIGTLVGAPRLGPPALGLWVAVLASVYAVIEYHWRRRGAALEESKG